MAAVGIPGLPLQQYIVDRLYAEQRYLAVALEDAYDDDLARAIAAPRALEAARARKLRSRHGVATGGRAAGFGEWAFEDRWEGGCTRGRLVRVLEGV